MDFLAKSGLSRCHISPDADYMRRTVVALGLLVVLLIALRSDTALRSATITSNKTFVPRGNLPVNNTALRSDNLAAKKTAVRSDNRTANNTVAPKSATTTKEAGDSIASVDGPGLITTPQKPDDVQKSTKFISTSLDVCEQLRKTLRGSSTEELSSRFLAYVYRQKRLIPSNSRLVLKIFMPRSGTGLCNARTFVLDNLVLAALVGADVVLPDVHTLDRPGSEPIAHQFEGYFDVQHLRTEWKRFCPSMVLYHDRRSEGSRGPFIEDAEREGALVSRHSTMVEVGSTRSDQDPVENNVEKRLNEMDVGIRGLLATKNGPKYRNNTKATFFVVEIRKIYLWDWSLPEEDASLGELRRAVGASLRSPEYIMRAAARVVEHLNALGEASGNGRRFCGAHLRSEPDMVRHVGSFANGTRLTDIFLEAAVAAGTKRCGVLYVAAGTKADLDRFSALTAAHNITLITLNSLIKTTALVTDAARWSYSQKAVFEYEILAASDKLFGAAVSSFSWNLAMRRYFAHSTDALPLRRIIRHLQPIPYDDAFSTIYLGPNRTNLLTRALRGMWP
ncbi:Hypothetical protein, putative [Bodo saltans]|uniref:Uncharacterized protein n=1 Tax=Bodo saltans TaxID=75058 RepID=A0A0S4J5V9_BODSA|nr:Hypothetical protein, putative [Bodo saltans]|eukprot:CUG86556.1 Hypothetical protein, putative [Bodo saltans]